MLTVCVVTVVVAELQIISGLIWRLWRLQIWKTKGWK